MSDNLPILDNLRKTLKHAQLAVSYPKGCPDIGLHLFDPNVLEGPISHDEAQAVVAEPAYWSFCWASGQVLARYLLQHPERVRHKTVLDVGSGSGIVAIAAAKAGAQKVIACDIDPAALTAVQANATLNGVRLETLDNLDALHSSVDLITAADLLYDIDNHPLLEKFRKISAEILLADSRVKVLPSKSYQQVACCNARTWPDLNEFEEFNQVRIYLAPGLAT